MSDGVQERLLGEFEPSSYEKWREAAESLLKGAPFEKVMRAKTPEGIVLEPIYREHDCVGLRQRESLPGQGDYLRGTRPGGYLEGGWKVAQELGQTLPSDFNKALSDCLRKGQDAIRVRLDVATRTGFESDEAHREMGREGLFLAGLDDFRKAFGGVAMEGVPAFFESGCSGLLTRAVFKAWLSENGSDLRRVSGGLGMDPLGVLAGEGRLPVTLDALLDESAAALRLNAKEMPEFATCSASGWPYHAAGASSTEEVACALATGVFYLRALAQRGAEISVAAKHVQIDLALGPDFFMEVAKLRAVRQLWSRVVRSLGGSDEAARLTLHARTGVFNKTKYDPYVNMLRSTTEALAAVVGGADSITVGRFDEILRPATEFSSRIARNVQLILREECELSSVIDPGGGSWYIERLTEEFARQAWSQFQLIESRGGQFECLKNGYIQELVRTTRRSKETLFGQRRIKLVGTNQYPNIQEPALASSGEASVEAEAIRSRAVLAARREDLDIKDFQEWNDAALEKLEALVREGATVAQLSRAARRSRAKGERCEALPDARLAVVYEEMREASAAYRAKRGCGPLLFLANIGPLKRHKARADFTRTFFEVGGFEVIYPSGFQDDASAAAAFKSSGARLAAICGTDSDYLERVPGLARSLKEANTEAKVILAGHPGENEARYREAGMDDYIFIKSDNYQTNRKYLAELGVL